MSKPKKPYPDGRDRYLMDTYGLSTEQWDKMFERQKKKCAICLSRIYAYHEKAGRNAACVDHDHGPSKRVRGLLCNKCNKKRVSNLTLTLATRIVEYLGSSFDGREL